MENNIVYIIEYRAHEFDDIDYGSFTPKYITLDKNEALEKFKEYKEKDIEHFNKFIEKYPKFKDSEDYKIETNIEDEFVLYIGNWCYEYYIRKYEMNKELKI